MSDLVSFTLVILLCANTKIFRKFLISFFIASYIGLFFWHFIPATSPRGYIDFGITHTNISLISQYKATPAPLSADYIEFTDKIWIDPTGVESNVSTFPSMHAAWAFLIVCSLISLIPLSAIILIPWYIALMVGAVAIYQHYGVDVFAGMILGSIIFKTTGRLLEFESKYFEDKYSLMYIWNIFENDSKKVIQFIKSKIFNKH